MAGSPTTHGSNTAVKSSSYFGKEALLERYTIAPIPPEARHGTARSLFAVFFGFTMGPLTIVTGLLGPTVFKLSFVWCVVAIVLGCLAGGLFMALHAAQGPRLGVPQMIQSRGQFGSLGSTIIYLVVFFLEIGFAASFVVVGGQSAAVIVPGISIGWWIVICGLFVFVIALAGYDLIHRLNRYLLPIFGISIIGTFLGVLVVKGLPLSFFSAGSFNFGGFLAMLSVSAVYLITNAPFVSDYSRYMPVAASSGRSGSRNALRGVGSTFWATYLGSNASVIPLLMLGAIIGVVLPTAVGVPDIYHSVGAGALGTFILVVFVIASIDDAAINIYSFALVVITLGVTGDERWKNFGVRARSVIVAIGTVAMLVLAVGFRNTFLVSYSDFLSLLFYLLIPWTIINLMDYYLLRKGSYDVPSFYQRDGGIYGLVQWGPFVAYILGVLVQVPFMNVTFYESPVARALNGGDISWLVATVVVPVLFVLLVWRPRTRASRLAQAPAMPPG